MNEPPQKEPIPTVLEQTRFQKSRRFCKDKNQKTAFLLPFCYKKIDKNLKS